MEITRKKLCGYLRFYYKESTGSCIITHLISAQYYLYIWVVLQGVVNANKIWAGVLHATKAGDSGFGLFKECRDIHYIIEKDGH